MKTHRCKWSLKAKASIRHEIHCGELNWWLSCFTLEYYGWRQSYLTEVKYCPYCGDKLEEMK